MSFTSGKINTVSKKRVLVLEPASGVTGMFKFYGESREFDPSPYIIAPDLVVFTGGPDVSPEFYGERKLPVSYTAPDRDKREKEIFEKYLLTPKVGICRGGQFLNVMSGGSMFQDVNNHLGSHLMTNLLKVPGIDEDKIWVTSTHHQMMRAGKDGIVIGVALGDKPKKGLATSYTSAFKQPIPEYDTEVVWYPKTKSLCFQPHPEYMSGKNNLQMTDYFFKLLDHFFFNDYGEASAS